MLKHMCNIWSSSWVMLSLRICCKHLGMIHRTTERHQTLPLTRYGNGISSILENFQEHQGVTQTPSTNPRTAGSSSLQITVQTSHVCAVILLPPSPLGMLSVPSYHGNSYMAVDLFASASLPGGSQVSVWPTHVLFACTSSSQRVASKLAVSLSIAPGCRLMIAEQRKLSFSFLHCHFIASRGGDLGTFIWDQVDDSHVVVDPMPHNVSPGDSSTYDFHPDVVHASWLCTSAAKGNYINCASLLASGFRCMHVCNAKLHHLCFPTCLRC